MMQLALVLVVTVVAALATWLRPRNGMGLTWLGGIALVYIGQRILSDDLAVQAATGLGLLLVVVTLAMRAGAAGQAEGATAATQRAALLWQAVGSLSLVVWFLTTSTVTDALGLEGDSYDRFTVSLTALFPIVFLMGAAPMMLIDQALGAHPLVMPEGARRQAVRSGLALAFGTALIVPANYLAAQHDQDWDFSYFRVTKPGTSSLALAANLDEPVEVLLFYPPANDVKEQMLPYFTQLAAASGGKLSVQVLDQPMVPVLAKELSIRDNGYVVFQRGDSHQKFKIDTDLRKARRELKKLDATAQKHLLKLVRNKRVAYFLTGHGEASYRGDNPFFKLSEFKKLLDAQNYTVKDFGLDEGSANAVPDDAAFIVVAAPMKALLPEETEALNAYVDKGGALFVLADPTRDPLTDLMGHVGLSLGTHPLAHATQFIPISKGLVDRINLVSQRFGSHATTTTLSKYSTRAAVVLPSAVAVRETGSQQAPGPAKHTPLIRSNDDTWEEANTSFQLDGDEKGEVHVLAMAVQGPDATPYRVVVVGDVSIASDFVVQRSQGSAVFVLDTVRWLTGDEDEAGEISNEEDVKIQHTRDGDTAWFFGTIFGMPLLLLILGAIFVRRRHSKA